MKYLSCLAYLISSWLVLSLVASVQAQEPLPQPASQPASQPTLQPRSQLVQEQAKKSIKSPATTATSTAATLAPRAAKVAKMVKPAAAKPASLQEGPVETPEEFLYEYLLSEIAGQRGQPTEAVRGIFELAERTRDPRLASRALEVAFQSGQMNEAREATILWLELEPNSGVARQVLGRMAGNDLVASQASFSRWLATPGKASILLMNVSSIFARFADKSSNLAAVRELAKPYPRLAESHYAMAQSALLAGENKSASAAIDEAIRLKAGWPQAAILKAQILREAKRDGAEQDALNYLQDFLKSHPEAGDVRLIYARLLVAQKSYLSAREEFRKIDADNSLKKITDPESPYAIALISLQIEDYAEAEKQFLRTLEAKPRDSNPVFFNLGMAAEAKKDPDSAISWFRRVGEGEYFVTAKLKAAGLMAKRDGLESGRKYLHDAQSAEEEKPEIRIQLILAEAQLLRDAKEFQLAFQLLDEAVKKNPDSSELLYDRAMVAEKIDKLDVMEADLARVIELKPGYAHAYNALGYTLAERNKRLDEAYGLIQKAVKLAPDDPFIQDSLGWVQFRLGRMDDALGTLKKAYETRRDPEIAAHLGEVLWAAGQRDEAQKLWRTALLENPGHDALAGLIAKYASK